MSNIPNTPIAPKVEKASSKVTNEFNNFVADVEEFIKSTTHLTGDDLVKAKAKINERIVSAKETATEIGEDLAAHARKTAAKTNAYAHENPWTVIGAGAALGLLAGYLLARRD